MFFHPRFAPVVAALIATTLACASSAVAAPARFSCSPGSASGSASGVAQRTVSIFYPREGHSTPCEVKYRRDAKAMEQTIFQARTEEGYCEKKAQEFVDKLKGMGWACASVD